MTGLEEWDANAPLVGDIQHQRIIERRLCQKMGKKFFRLPPVVDDSSRDAENVALVSRRFPEWLQCPECEVLRPASKWSQDPGSAARYCASCTSAGVGNRKVFALPVRFVAACEKGHLDEFPWNWWVRHKDSCGTKDKLKLKSVAPGLAGLIVQCTECGAARSLDGTFSKTALKGLVCNGKRPWLRTNDPSCTCSGESGTFRVLQRGASNLFYPVLETALDIPPWTRQLEVAIGDYWDDLVQCASTEDRLKLIAASPGLQRILEKEGLDAKALAERFETMAGTLNGSDLSDLKVDEYRIFASGSREASEEFESAPEKLPQSAGPYLASVMRVARLREVRVAKGFTRINPPFETDAAEIAPISTVPLDWLPAIDVRGEGIFLRLNPKRLSAWAELSDVQSRCSFQQKAWAIDWDSRHPGKERPFDVGPELLLIHTLSHALIRALTLECGYSSASLRERLYVGGEAEMAGLLIYTATPDAEGTLGGLQRRAGPEFLDVTLGQAIESSRWCSSDPLCLAGEMSAPDSFSGAACHACALLPETSCEMHNRFLDRALLVGTEGSPDVGFFRQLLEELD
jgi:hypothetical protein